MGIATSACSSKAPGAEAPDAETPQPIAAEDIKQAATGKTEAAFYALNGWQSAWTDQKAAALDKALAGRNMHGLDRLPIAVAAGASATPAQRDVARTRAALAYAAALGRGATDPTRLYPLYEVPRPAPDLVRGLAEALQQDRLDTWFGSLAPQDEGYHRLSEAYLGFSREAAAGERPDIPDVVKPIAVDQSNPRIPSIRARLIDNEYLAAPAPAAANQQAQNRYTPWMAEGIKRLQADYGIAADGVIGADTLAVLNLSAADRARAAAVALERLRWLERIPPPTRIDVNTATARLSYWRDGKMVDERKVVVGRPDTETPQLGSPIFRLVANPTWTVPQSIQKKELSGKGSAYFRRNNMIWKNGRIVQQPGPKNSLGLVKFDMQNNHAIYLHDTPAKPLFERNQRQLSHGCVRVYDALGFADMIANDQGIAEAWARARATGKETFVPLAAKIPVRLIYATAFVNGTGQITIRADPYGWNDRVAAGLGLGDRSGPRFKTGTDDVGP